MYSHYPMIFPFKRYIYIHTISIVIPIFSITFPFFIQPTAKEHHHQVHPQHGTEVICTPCAPRAKAQGARRASPRGEDRATFWVPKVAH